MAASVAWAHATRSAVVNAIRPFMTSLIDYAGLFPPAKLEMAPAVRNYAAYRSGPYAWMLGRFIVPFARLDEFEHEVRPVLVETATAGEPWPLSVLISDVDPDTLAAFNDLAERTEGGVEVVAIEMKTGDVAMIDRSLDVLPETIIPYFEFPLDRDYRGFMTALAGEDAGAKIRTGGLEPHAFPSTKTVSTFIHRCADNAVALKATAGLHHPIRRRNNDIGVMEHGFLNVFGAAVIASSHRLSESEIEEIISIQNADAFRFTTSAMIVNAREATIADIESGRRLAHGYGSCSFDEPVEDLQSLGLLE